MPATIPGNAFQRAVREAQHELKRGDPHAMRVAYGVILKVFDPDVLETTELPARITQLAEDEPGVLWAEVKLLSSGQVRYYRFEENDESVLSQNSNQLVGQYVRVLFTGTSIEFGFLRLAGKPKTQIVSVARASRSADIGDLL